MNLDNLTEEKVLVYISRLWAKIEITPKGCWEYTGARTNGYGVFGFEGKTRRVHRFMYSLYTKIPKDYVIDHLCRNRACCNPLHLEAVTFLENVRRGEPAQRTHCPYGHPYDEKNTYYRKDVYGRECRACNYRRGVERAKRLRK